MSRTNPFEVFDIDPLEGPEAITERMRELATAAENEEDRAGIRAAWQQLTRDPRQRLLWAFAAHPESRPRVGIKPPRSRIAVARPLELEDLVPFVPLVDLLGPEVSMLPPFEDDPLLKPQSPSGSYRRLKDTK